MEQRVFEDFPSIHSLQDRRIREVALFGAIGNLPIKVSCESQVILNAGRCRVTLGHPESDDFEELIVFRPVDDEYIFLLLLTGLMTVGGAVGGGIVGALLTRLLMGGS